MTAVWDAIEALAGVTAAGLRGYRGDQVGQAQLPAFFVGAPDLTADTYCQGPASGSFPVTVAGRLDSSVMEVLAELVPLLWAAIESQTDGTVSTATPTQLDIGNGSAGAYVLTVDYPLT